MSSFEESMEAAAWRSIGRPASPTNPDWLAGVASERHRCLAIVAEAGFGYSNPERRQIIADLIRRIEGTA